MTEEEVIELAAIAHRRYWKATSDESTGDRQAACVTRAWQKAVVDRSSGRFVPEKPVGDLNERIDLMDPVGHVAFEMKVSGKNPHHEFYKDIFKVVVHNKLDDMALRKLIFITEECGAQRLRKGLGNAVVQGANLGFVIEVHGV